MSAWNLLTNAQQGMNGAYFEKVCRFKGQSYILFDWKYSKKNYFISPRCLSIPQNCHQKWTAQFRQLKVSHFVDLFVLPGPWKSWETIDNLG